ncbi:MAG: serine hydrolase [Candidatus Aminicenantes bacterium]|nr:MAG: serine hydrolase [Candidatus Aminicenantes bacterium]
MKLLTRKRIWTGIIIILTLLFIFVGYFVVSNISSFQLAPIGIGYKAKVLCSGIFISQRELQSILSEDLSYPPELGMTTAKINYENQSVTASVYGLMKRQAVYREGLGCTLLSGFAEDEILSQPSALPLPLPENPENVPWPTGDKIETSEIPPNVDGQLIQQALDKAFSEPDTGRLRRTRAVVIVYNGHLVAERYSPGITKNTPLIGWSMTKSVTSALVGILVGQGKLSLEEPAPVPEWKEPGDPRRAITLDHLLRMSSGLKFIEEYEDNPASDVNIMLFIRPDAAAYAASMPAEARPDEKWSYSSGTTNIVSRIIRHTLGNQADYAAFPRKALFNRIGMRSAIMEMDASGTYVGSSFMYASARDWARFGLLYLQDGIWEGERILPEGWVKYSTTPTPRASKGQYGAHFWLNRGDPENPENRQFPQLPTDLFLAWGFQEQQTVILPSHKLVVVRLGMTHQGQWGLEPFILDVLKAIE